METRPIPNAPGYFARSDGVIIGPGGYGHGAAPLKPVMVRGYWRVGIRVGKNLFRLRCVNRLIALAFHGEPPTPKHHAAHRDGNRDNNIPGNIAWLTPTENAADKARHGRERHGERKFNARLTEALVLEARQQYAQGRPILRLAKQYGVHWKTLQYALLGRTWAHVSPVRGPTTAPGLTTTL